MGSQIGVRLGQVTDGQYGDHHEAICEYRGPLERAPASTWKVELEKSNKKFENKLGKVNEKLDDMMDQFKQLLTSPITGSCSPGRQTGTESCHHCGERGHSKMECPNYGVKQNGNSTIKLKRDYSGGRSESPQIKLGLSVVESVPQGRVAEIAIIGPGVCARDREGNREPSVSVQVKAEIESEQCSVSDKEATPSGGLDCYLLKCLANILRHGAPGLDHSLLPGGYLLVEEILKRDPGFARYSLPDIHKLVTVDVDRRFTLIKDSDSGCWKIRANQGYSFIVDTPAIPLVEKCEVPQGNLDTLALLTGDQEGPVANIVRGPNGAILAIENNSSIQKVAAPTETTSASDEEAQESWDSTSDSEAHTTLVEGANDEKIVTVFPTPVVDGGMTDNTENSHSPPIEDPSSTGETDRKAATESNNPVNQESVYINPESPDLGLGLLFKTGNVGTRYFNQQKPPPVDSGASVFCVSTVRSGPNRRQWDPGIPYPNKGIKTVQVRKNETKLFTMENGSAQLSGSNYIVDMQPLNGPVLVCIKTGKNNCTDYTDETITSTEIDKITSTAIGQTAIDEYSRLKIKDSTPQAVDKAMCSCPCQSMDRSTSVSEIDEVVAKIKQELRIDKKNLSSYKRSKSSQTDTRALSMCIGIVGGTVISIPIISIIICDVINMLNRK
ncbi:unnamed protein product [Mytilus edulis]|uniref:2'-phosphotransferase n=1 Tax=Mytilus edulis TaxID=6550 RepID=A0A8S3QG04_MYTED|nr:unnamed protein product [Mytilus edulis]